MAGRPWLVARRQHTQLVEGVIGGPLVAVGQGEPVLAGLGGFGEDLVVDVGDIADERDVIAVAARQPAPQHIEGDGETDVADVRRRLGGEPADVDADLARGDGHEVAQLLGGGVEESKAHPVKGSGAWATGLHERGLSVGSPSLSQWVVRRGRP